MSIDKARAFVRSTSTNLSDLSAGNHPIIRAAILAASAVLISGCGFSVPNMHEFYQTETQHYIDENAIVAKVKCELHMAVREVRDRFRADGIYIGNNLTWIEDWAAKVNLTITVDEKGSINPGLTYLRPFQNALRRFPENGNITIPRNFSLGAGVQGNSSAARSETIGVEYYFRELLTEPKVESCDVQHGPIQLQGDLKIREWIWSKAILAGIPGTTPDRGGSPYTVFNYQVTFILTAADLPLNFHPAAVRASANVTPFGAVSVPA